MELRTARQLPDFGIGIVAQSLEDLPGGGRAQIAERPGRRALRGPADQSEPPPPTEDGGKGRDRFVAAELTECNGGRGLIRRVTVFEHPREVGDRFPPPRRTQRADGRGARPRLGIGKQRAADVLRKHPAVGRRRVGGRHPDFGARMLRQVGKPPLDGARRPDALAERHGKCRGDRYT